MSRHRPDLAAAPGADGFDLPPLSDEDADDAPLCLDVEGFEGPLHVLLALARTRKIDVAAVSIADLAAQYIAFIDAARVLRLDLAADYLVMAAWLALLKSKALLPRQGGEDDLSLSPEEAARALAFRLRRLAGMRQASTQLFAGELEGRDVFVRGGAGGPEAAPGPVTADLFSLLKAYGSRRARTARARVVRTPMPVYALDAARARLKEGLAHAGDWQQLDLFMPGPQDWAGVPPPARSVRASGFVAGLELAKAGEAELRQDEAFGPIYVRAASRPAATPAPAPASRPAARRKRRAA